MPVSKNWKIAGLTLVLVIIVAAVAAPAIARAIVKNKIDTKLHDELGDTAHYESMAMTWSPLGATVTNLSIGAIASSTTIQPGIKINSIAVELNSAFDSEPHFKSMNLHGVSIDIVVDDQGESSFNRFVREKPRSRRTRPLTIDVLTIDGVTISTFVAPRATPPLTTSGAEGQAAPEAVVKPAVVAPSNPAATSILTVGTIRATDYVIPIPGQLLGREQWVSTVVNTITASAPNGNAGAKSEACLHIGQLTFELDQPESTESPARLRHFKIDRADLLNDISAGAKPEIQRVADSIQQAFGLKEPTEVREATAKPSMPSGTGILIEDMQTTTATIETRGSDAAGRPAFWRLKDAKVQAENLAFGERVKTPAPGFLKLESATESSSVPGSINVAITELNGSYPRSSFRCNYQLQNLAATAFSSMAKGSENVGIERGSMTLSFAGGATEGQLAIDGSVTLSDDFEISGDTTKKLGVKMTRGTPIDHVTIDGTIEHPQIHLPQDLALLGNFFGSFLVGGPLGIADATVGKIPVVGTVFKETEKAGGKVLGKIPVIGGIFKKGDKDKDKDNDR